MLNNTWMLDFQPKGDIRILNSASNLQYDLTLITSCSGPQFPYLYNKKVRLEILSHKFHNQTLNHVCSFFGSCFCRLLIKSRRVLGE